MATHSSILAWRIPLTEEPGGVQSYQGLWRPWGDKESPWGHKEPDTTEGTGPSHIHNPSRQGQIR